MALAIAEFLVVAYFVIRYWRIAVPLAIGWFLLWAAPPFAEGMRNGFAKYYGLTASNSVVDIAAEVFVVLLVGGCMMGRWTAALVVGGIMLAIWVT